MTQRGWPASGIRRRATRYRSGRGSRRRRSRHKRRRPRACRRARRESGLAIQREGSARAVVPALRVRQKRFAPRRHPAHRPAQAARRPDDDGLLRIVLALVSEPAAHVGRYHAKLGLLRPSSAHSAWRRWCGVCVAQYSVMPAGPGTAAMPRFSIAAPHRRLLTSSISTRCAAPANASLYCRGVASRPTEAGLALPAAAARKPPRPARPRPPRRARVSANTAATGSPTWRTVSRASAQRGISDHARQLPAGSHRADAVLRHVSSRETEQSFDSMLRMRACACGERTSAQCSAPGISRSSTKRPPPVRKRRSSTRRTDRPITPVLRAAGRGARRSRGR